jgi:hypothetical protein
MLMETDLEIFEPFDDITTLEGDDFKRTESEDVSSQSVKIVQHSRKKYNRKNRKKYLAHTIPPIIKRDIRRLYGRMLTNVFNCHNFITYKAFFETFCSGHIQVRRQIFDVNFVTFDPGNQFIEIFNLIR